MQKRHSRNDCAVHANVNELGAAFVGAVIDAPTDAPRADRRGIVKSLRFSMSNVKRPMSNVQCTCQTTQRPNYPMDWSSGRCVSWSFDKYIGHSTWDV